MKKYIVLSLSIIVALCITGCNSGNKDNSVSGDSVVSTDASGVQKIEIRDSDLLGFMQVNNYDSYKIDTDVGITYYWYDPESYGLVIDENDSTKRVIKNDIVYLADDTQYWESVYDFDDDPITMDNIIMKRHTDNYYLVDGWYYEDYNELSDSVVSMYKYKPDKESANKITVAKIEYIDRDKEPFNNKVIEEVNYTITEIKSKDEVPMVDFTKLEEVSVTAPDVEDNWEVIDSDDEFDEHIDEEVAKEEAD